MTGDGRLGQSIRITGNIADMGPSQRGWARLYEQQVDREIMAALGESLADKPPVELGSEMSRTVCLMAATLLAAGRFWCPDEDASVGRAVRVAIKIVNAVDGARYPE